ncbi:MAG TPA: glycosyltransferase family 39 protein [Anaerolineae bacterium]|nr:glycosyltransferase family 39 protein [Anaerolineae bacterium]
MKIRFAAIGLLLIQSWLMWSTLAVTAPTVDEPLHIVRGYAYAARGEDRLRLRGPVLPNALSGAALWMEPALRLPPAADPIWLRRDDTELHEKFMWSNAVPPQRIIYWARLPILFAGLLLGALVFRWASQRSGAGPALGALAFYTFCPNILAHARLATADMVTAATFFFGAYAFTRALDAPTRPPRFLSGVALGLALAAKFSALALAVAFVVQAAFRVWRERGRRAARRVSLATVLITFGMGGLALWAIYGFKVAPVEPGGAPLPAPSYWGEWQALSEYLQEPLPGYLFGEISTRGWWYYYPVVFLVKTPLPVLILLVLITTRTVRARDGLRDLPLYLPSAFLLGSLLFSPHDLGYRYLLPLLPFIFVAGADVISATRRRGWGRVAIGLLIGWQVWGTLRIYPYYLTYFNEIVGGPDGGRFILSDSNLDWGQDLIGLKHYVDQNHLTDLKFSYFGNTDPAAYGLHTYALPPVRSAMHNQGAWWLHTYHPVDPAPGVYAISVSNLMGGLWIDQQTYASFRHRTPDATIGHSIYLYTIPARGAPVDLALSGLQLDQIDPATYARFGTNDVRVRWFDAATSLIAPPGSAWIALSDTQPIAPEFAALFEGTEPVTRAQAVDDERAYRLYFFDLAARLRAAVSRSEQQAGWSEQGSPTLAAAPTLELPARFGETAALIGYEVSAAAGRVSVVTYWQAGAQVVTPLQLFVHAVGSDGDIVAQEDRLDAPAYGWREGDLIAQVNRLALPDVSGPVWLQIGLYQPDSGERLPVIVAGREVDRRLRLKAVELE